MKSLLSLIILFLLPFASQAREVPILACQAPAIEQALALSFQVVQKKSYEIKPRQALRDSVLSLDLAMIEVIENNFFFKKVFNLGPDVFPGASLSADETSNDIAIYPETAQSLNESFQDPRGAHMFMMAHEMAHLVQRQWAQYHPGQGSPHQLKAGVGDDAANILHAETDCIGVEIMKKAGQKNFSQVVPTLQIIGKECEEFNTKEFCERATQTRVLSIEKYLQSFLE